MSEKTKTKKSPEINNDELVIERAIVADAPQIVEIRRQGWLSTYPNEQLGITKEDISKRIEGENGEVIQQAVERWRQGIETDVNSLTRASFVARLDGRVVGFTGPRVESNGQRRIGALYVLPGMQGRGIGTQLLQAAVDWHGRQEDIYLHVVSHNHNAIEFYEKFGFIKTDNEVNDPLSISGESKLLPEIEMVLPKHQIT